MLEHVEAFAQVLGAWGYPGLGVAAFLEYVFPPFPGDTLVVLGGAWAVREDRSIALVHLLLTLGSVLGMAATWGVGKGMAGRIRLAPEGSRVLGLEVGRIRKAQALMRARGGWLLIANRFLPSFRAVLFVAAGASDVPLWRTLLLGSISAAGFNTVLLAAGVAVGDNAEAIAAFLRSFRGASLFGVAAVAIVLLARFLWLRRRAKSRT